MEKQSYLISERDALLERALKIPDRPLSVNLELCNLNDNENYLHTFSSEDISNHNILPFFSLSVHHFTAPIMMCNIGSFQNFVLE